jgi:serine protease Do
MNSSVRVVGLKTHSILKTGALALCLAIPADYAMSSPPVPTSSAPPQESTPSSQSSLVASLPASFAPVVDKIKSTVVSVRTKASTDESGDDDDDDSFPGLDVPPGLPPGLEEFLRRFGEGMDRPKRRFFESQGSGFFISTDGYIVTNDHVVNNAVNVTIKTDDGREFPAKVIGTDPKTDVALLKINAPNEKFPVATFATQAPRVGDWVIAVGNPFGLGGTVTAGIISARGRDIGLGQYDDFLQIDAPVNKGNSGGPTFNLDGHVVAVNTAIFTPSGGSVGIAFGIPAETVQSVVEVIKKEGSVKRGYLGVEIQPITPDIAASLGLPKAEGAIIARVMPDSAAAKAGIRSADVVMDVDGKPITSPRELSRAIASLPPGKETSLKIWREGKSLTVSVKLDTLSGSGSRTNKPGQEGESVFEDLKKLGLLRLSPSRNQEGVMILAIKDGSVAEERGLKAGDVILEMSNKKIQTVSELESLFKETRQSGKKSILLKVKGQDGAQRFIGLPVEAPKDNS